MANKANSLAHTKWMCKYHIVFTPKHRRKIIYNQLKVDIRNILKQLCSYKGVEIIEGHLMPDHVHMLVSIPLKYSVPSFMGYLKGKSALMIFDKHANLKYKFGNRHFWSEGYYVSTVGLNEATIKKYIQDQEKADIMQDKLKEILVLGPGMQVDIYADRMSSRQLGLFCLAGPAATQVCGWCLTAAAEGICRIKSGLLRSCGYYVTMAMLLLDPLYMSLLCGL